ncbi:biotin transporter BioY [Bifidobacterium aemilianum]|uniref:biotin transporter BioY n=1 Tax=Bifidobacterium aemilianum TaxID=2493120 RepID=UPI001374BA31|nr:biotin transporter BioY [Bifidobacterium aemilianum]
MLTTTTSTTMDQTGRICIWVRGGIYVLSLWTSAAVGAIHIPGTPVPLTLQSFVLLLMGLTLPWRQAGSIVTAYLAAGALGLPVFANGGSTMSLLGPSAGFLLGFLPGVMLTAWLRQRLTVNPTIGAWRRMLSYLLAGGLGCLLLVYLLGFGLQSAITGVPSASVAAASTAFVPGDLIKLLAATIISCGSDEWLRQAKRHSDSTSTQK